MAAATLPVTVDGDGEESLFFIHGWPDSERLWDAQVAHFKGKYRCLRITMPHYGGREVAEKLGHEEQGLDFHELADVLAATIRREAAGRPLTLVIHDWGCVWGFLAQERCPEVVKAVVAMDVGHPSGMASSWRTLPKAIVIGLIYQYWLAGAFGLARATRGTALEGAGQSVGDGVTRAVVNAVRALGNEAPDPSDGRITADMGYPYWMFAAGWGVRGVEPWDGASLTPSCPCLFFHGGKKAFPFHSPAFERHLKSRSDCRVVSVKAGHWLMVEQPDEVNAAMEAWLDATLSPSGAASSL